ncbi:hypothetical protein ABZZ79_09015 [Streptomyces sp. NPDC006458]|uniref:hypothetical protein n=1 Tax=Streptomyces sp. NPDC006458 TaxID=3154302 RepID=UPI0033BF02C0
MVSRGGREWQLTERIGAGSEGLVYAVGHDGSLVAKLVPDPADPVAYRRRVERLVRQRREPRTVRLLAGTPQRVAWPLAAVRTLRDDVEGYLMPDLRRDFLPFTALLTEAGRPDALPGATWATALAAAEALARLLADLHTEGYVVGDLNPDNLWVDAHGRVGMADVDSWQFTDGHDVFPGRMRTPGYTAPERMAPNAGTSGAPAGPGEETRAPAAPPVPPDASTDAFALAVLVHQLLMGGLHPFAGHPADGDYLSLDDNVLHDRCRLLDRTSVVLPRTAPPADLLPRALDALLRAAFSAAGSRPPAAVWARELAAARAPGRLARCTVRATHVHTVERPWCPWCDQARRGMDSYPEPA